MGDTWIPDDVLSMKPIMRNFFENTSTVQVQVMLPFYTTVNSVISVKIYPACIIKLCHTGDFQKRS